MEYLILSTCLLILIAVGSLMLFIQRLRVAVENVGKPPSAPKEKRILVPGRGLFSQPKPKTKPIYKTDEEIWMREQEERERTK